MKIIKKQHVKGVLINKYHDKNDRGIAVFMSSEDGFESFYHENAFQYAEIGDSVVKESGECTVHVIKDGEARSFPATCSGREYK